MMQYSNISNQKEPLRSKFQAICYHCKHHKIDCPRQVTLKPRQMHLLITGEKYFHFFFKEQLFTQIASVPACQPAKELLIENQISFDLPVSDIKVSGITKLSVLLLLFFNLYSLCCKLPMAYLWMYMHTYTYLWMYLQTLACTHIQRCLKQIWIAI